MLKRCLDTQAYLDEAWESNDISEASVWRRY